MIQVTGEEAGDQGVDLIWPVQVRRKPGGQALFFSVPARTALAG
jgi:hypothetical protein